ncbi:MAG: alpha/beta fold hydrolase [Steroidobacterales bacterium]
MQAAIEAPTVYRCRREARHETLQLRGLEIHLRRWGPAPSRHSATLFCLHGWQDNGDTFQFLADEFAADRAVIALDWRGFGRSAWARDGYAFSDYLADLEALLNLFSPRMPAMLLGHSMGGNIACLYAGVRPERIRCIVNLEGFGLPATVPTQAPARMRQWLDELQVTPPVNEYDSFEHLAAAVRQRHPRIDAARARFLATAWAEADERGSVRLRGDPRHKRVFPMLYRRDESEACWREITAPMFALAGAESSFLAQWGANNAIEDFRRCVPHMTVKTIDGLGHMLHLERPEIIAPMIEAFLDAH